ncbi:hypothetical protein ACE1CD_17675 [Aerosakkonema sp. BLCC-F183]|uniref:hypothetical protein n=1 Tax=Aerosakkonema sp. BLCC-F183 TaxID=3342834 RepID=UPI0035B89606
MAKETTMHVVIPADLKKEFKSVCVLKEVNMSQVVCELIQDWLEKNKGMGTVVTNQPGNNQ